MDKDSVYELACDTWNDFVQEIYRDWCKENGLQVDDDYTWEEWLASDANAGLIAFLTKPRPHLA